MEHYDPTNAEHQKYEVPKEASKVSAEEQSTIENKAEDEVPQVSKETYYEVDASLKNLFSQSTENEVLRMLHSFLHVVRLRLGVI